MLLIRYFTEKSNYMREIIGEKEIWTKESGGKIFDIGRAVYNSPGKHEELNKYYDALLKEFSSQFTKELVEDFMEDAKEEDFNGLGGFINFFVKRGDYYTHGWSSEVKRIEEFD